MPQPFGFEGRTALITGAGSGIGRALAQDLAARGCHLALVDMNAAGLDETARALGRDGAAGHRLHLSTHVLDVTDRGALAALPAALAATHPGLDLLINNAGLTVGGRFEDVPEASFDRVMDVNFNAVVRITRLFLPVLRRSADAHLVFLSSLFGLIAPPEQAAYVASKFAVRGFAQSLRHELEGSRVGVTVVHPGGVATSIAANAPPSPVWSEAEREHRRALVARQLVMPPAEAARIILAAVSRRQPRVIVGRDARTAALIEWLFPATYWTIIGRSLRIK